MYSKHIANGAMQEYMISQVLPDVASTRLDGSGNYNEGIARILSEGWICFCGSMDLN